jgi:sucrose-6-phosphate hydrolase SacC (GH32 family)
MQVSVWVIQSHLVSPTLTYFEFVRVCLCVCLCVCVCMCVCLFVFNTVSPDALRWTHLPVALSPNSASGSMCPGMGRGEVGIFSGSGGVYDGLPTLSYSVYCNQNVALAVPSNRSDIYLTNWTALWPSNGPIANRSSSSAMTDCFRDPTAAWKGADGDWRMAVGCNDGPCLLKSANAKEWKQAGMLHNHSGVGDQVRLVIISAPSPTWNAR